MSGSEGSQGLSEIEEAQLSELELTLTVLWNTVRRWLNQRSNTNIISGLSDFDVFLLHMLVYRNKQLRGSDLAFALAIDDLHLVSYSLKKITKLGFAGTSRVGKEVFYRATDKGKEHYAEFLKDRQKYLEPAMRFLFQPGSDPASINTSLRAMCSAYEQAARGAASSRGL